MKASELRIGNIIKDDRKSKEWRFVTHRIISDLASNPGVDMYHAIPLTEEWLIKFGFELKRIDEDDTFERYQLPISKTSWYLANVITYGSVTLFNNRDHTSTGVGAQYVHQLQNLFYALCGEELTIKK